MEIVLYIYFAINLFLAGYWFNENDKWENRKYAIFFSSVCTLFGVLGYLIYLFLIYFSPILGWIKREITFQCRFYFTSYWDKVMLDDNYSYMYKNRKEKLKRAEELVEHSSKQIVRHSKQIQNKYGNISYSN